MALPLSLPELIVAAYGVERGSFDAEVLAEFAGEQEFELDVTPPNVVQVLERLPAPQGWWVVKAEHGIGLVPRE